MIKVTLLLALFVVFGLSTSFFNIVKLPTSNGAKCLDGSQYGIYVCQPDKDDVPVIANRLLIVWEDFPHGWCFQTNTSASLEACYNLTGDWASSKGWSNTQFFLNGILSFQGGGFFYNWVKVVIKSCDGGSYLGYSDPVAYKQKKVYFRGSQNIK